MLKSRERGQRRGLEETADRVWGAVEWTCFGPFRRIKPTKGMNDWMRFYFKKVQGFFNTVGS